VLFINASEHFTKDKRQNRLDDRHIHKIVNTYQDRLEEARYSRRVELSEIEKNDFVRISASAPPRNKTPCGRMIAIVPSLSKK
jgi:hypothetical protein